MSNQSPTFADLSFGDKLLVVGHASGCLAACMIGLGSIFKMIDHLPGAPISFGHTQQPTNNNHTAQPTGRSGYFDK